MSPQKLEKILNDNLEYCSFEEFLENFDVTPFELFELAYDSGLIDDDILEGLIASDE